MSYSSIGAVTATTTGAGAAWAKISKTPKQIADAWLPGYIKKGYTVDQMRKALLSEGYDDGITPAMVEDILQAGGVIPKTGSASGMSTATKIALGIGGAIVGLVLLKVLLD